MIPALVRFRPPLSTFHSFPLDHSCMVPSPLLFPALIFTSQPAQTPYLPLTFWLLCYKTFLNVTSGLMKAFISDVAIRLLDLNMGAISLALPIKRR